MVRSLAYRTSQLRSPPGGPFRGPLPGASGADLNWKVRSARDRTIRTIQIRVRSEFFQNSLPKKNSGIFARKILRKFKNFGKFQHFLVYRKSSDKISSKSEQKSPKRIQKLITKCCKILPKNAKKFDEKFLKYWGLSGAKACKSCRSRQELSNEYLLAKFGVDTEENEPCKVCSFGWKIGERFDIEPFN